MVAVRNEGCHYKYNLPDASNLTLKTALRKLAEMDNEEETVFTLIDGLIVPVKKSDDLKPFTLYVNPNIYGEREAHMLKKKASEEVKTKAMEKMIGTADTYYTTATKRQVLFELRANAEAEHAKVALARALKDARQARAKLRKPQQLRAKEARAKEAKRRASVGQQEEAMGQEEEGKEEEEQEEEEEEEAVEQVWKPVRNRRPFARRGDLELITPMAPSIFSNPFEKLPSKASDFDSIAS